MMRPTWWMWSHWVCPGGLHLILDPASNLVLCVLEFHDGNGFVTPRHSHGETDSTLETENSSSFPTSFSMVTEISH